MGLEAPKGIDTVHEIAQALGVHPVQVRQWKKEVMERLPDVFSKKPDMEAVDRDALEAELFKKIGQLEMELDWLKKNQPSSPV